MLGDAFNRVGRNVNHQQSYSLVIAEILRPVCSVVKSQQGRPASPGAEC